MLDKTRKRPENKAQALHARFLFKRRFCTPYNKLANNFKATITLTYIERCLRSNFFRQALILVKHYAGIIFL